MLSHWGFRTADFLLRETLHGTGDEAWVLGCTKQAFCLLSYTRSSETSLSKLNNSLLEAWISLRPSARWDDFASGNQVPMKVSHARFSVRAWQALSVCVVSSLHTFEVFTDTPISVHFFFINLTSQKGRENVYMKRPEGATCSLSRCPCVALSFGLYWKGPCVYWPPSLGI